MLKVELSQNLSSKYVLLEIWKNCANTHYLGLKIMVSFKAWMGQPVTAENLLVL